MGGRHLAVFGEERNSKLDDSEKIDVTAKSLVMIVCLCSETSHRSSDDTWELCVLPQSKPDLSERLHSFESLDL